MKTNKILAIILSMFFAIAITSCVEDDDFSVPNATGNEENVELNKLLADIENGDIIEVSIEEAKLMYHPNGSNSIPFPVDTDIVVKGYVSSSDATGNFYKEFYIQDSPENPTHGLQIITSTTDTYNKYNKGREVYIKLKGLFIGETRVGNGIITIGGGTESDQYGTTVTAITNNQESKKLLRSNNTETLIPLSTSFSAINNDHIGLFVQFDNVEFADDLAGERYFDPEQDYDTQRMMQSCGVNYINFPLETSAFSTFKNELLPTLNGSIAGVITKNYTGDTLLLALNTTDDVNFSNERCTLLQPIFSEDFQSANNNTNLDLPGWTNFAEAGSWVWREKVYQGNGYAEFSTFNSGSPVNIAWLVSPGIDMDAQTGELLNFRIAQHHLDSPNNTMEVFVSTDFDGTDVLGATWEPLSPNLPTQDTSWYDFVDSGLIDISNYTGTLYVAFKVTGSGTDTDLDGAYQVDDFAILAN